VLWQGESRERVFPTVRPKIKWEEHAQVRKAEG
jgi:hypothetical protein